MNFIERLNVSERTKDVLTILMIVFGAIVVWLLVFFLLVNSGWH